MYLTQTVAAISTPPGQGGIAVVRISGEQAVDVAEKVFFPHNPEKRLKTQKGYTALYGSYASEDGQIFDHGVALLFHTPHSYTGEDVVELSCHGGEQVSRMLLSACFAAGAAPAGPGEFTRRAVLNGRMDLTQAEAVMDIIEAGTRQSAALANAALEGRLFQQIQKIKTGLLELAGHLAAHIDYPDEGVEELTTDEFLAAAEQATQQLQALLDGYGQGQILKRGVQTAIVGSPNVGKSTLFNLLSGFERAIVTPVAGTTRDILRETIVVGGIPLLLSDTAGLHETKDIVEAEGIRRSYAEFEKAGLLFVVFDGSRPMEEADIELARQCKDRPAIAILNKQDLGLATKKEAIYPYFQTVLVLSAREEASRKQVEKAVSEILQTGSFDPDAAFLSNERQYLLVKRALFALQEAKEALQIGLTLDAAGVCLQDALQEISTLTGENVSEEIINDVFSRFCVGK